METTGCVGAVSSGVEGGLAGLDDLCIGPLDGVAEGLFCKGVGFRLCLDGSLTYPKA